MHRVLTRWLVGTVVVAAALSFASSRASASPVAGSVVLPAGVTDPCAVPTGLNAMCDALTTAAAATTTPTGYGPTDLRSAYGFQSATAGSGQTVAIVTAYDDPDAESDLGVYRSQYSIPPCTTADGCFKKVDQTGGTSYPGTAAGWSIEAAQSMDMISAVCPNCHILLVEASSYGIADLGAAEDEAVALGAKFIDNDWGIAEASLGSSEPTYDTYFNHPGVAITAPTGTGGYGDIQYPAASQYVTAVGATTLTADSSVARGWTETPWVSTDSGCSAYEPKPSWQTDTGCTGRTVADIAAVGDPSAPGIAYYDTPTENGWQPGGGTDFSAAIIAAAYALAGTPASGSYPASYPYLHPGGSYTSPGTAYPYSDGLNSVTSGSNASSCTPSYLCTAGPGYNGPTGLGTPSTQVALSGTGALNGSVYGGITDMCIDDTNNSTTDGNKIQLWNCWGDPAQDWTPESNGTIQLHSSGYCLDVTNGGTANGTKLQLWSCLSGDANQQWTPLADGALYNPQSGKCLDDPGSTTTQGTQLQIFTCNQSAAQVWLLPYTVPSSTGAITSQLYTSKCVDDYTGSTADGNLIDLYNCNQGSAQSWTVASNGTLQVFGKCMATTSDGTANGTKIELWGCTGDTNQHWLARSDGTLVNVKSGTCLDDSNASSTNGNPLQIWACNGLDQQYWKLPSLSGR